MPDAPLPLFRVLEEEFAAIHGENADPVDWSFTADDVLDESAILDALKRARSKEPGIDAWFAQSLSASASPRAELARELTLLLKATSHVDTLVSIFNAEINPQLHKWRKLMDTEPEAIDDDEQLNRLRLEQVFAGMVRRISDQRLAAIYHKMLEKDQAALCLSGGGIRSATFALGVLQALARRDLVTEFNYLSTVSGGGYIGSWLSSWFKLERHGVISVAQALKSNESRPIRHLRAYSNYLTPRLGLFSGDTWAVVGTYLRNLFLNLHVLMPLLFAIVLLPRGFAGLLRDFEDQWAAAVGLLSVGMVLAFFAIAHLTAQRPSNRRTALDRSQPPRTERWFFAASLVPLLLATVCFCLYWAASMSNHYTQVHFLLFGIALQLGSVVRLDTSSPRRWGVEFMTLLASGALGGYLLFFFVQMFPAGAPRLLATFGPLLFILSFLTAATFYVAIISRTRYSKDEDLEWWARTGGWTMLFAFAWTALAAVVIYLPGFALTWPWFSAATGGIVTTATGAVQKMLRRMITRGGAEDQKVKMLSGALRWLAPASAIVLLCAMSLTVSVIATASHTVKSDAFEVRRSEGSLRRMTADELRAAHDAALEATGTRTWAVIGGLVLFGLGVSLLVDINKYSMHSMYRNRLTRAYLGASRARRHPDPFTGFDPADSVDMHELSRESFTETSFYDLDAFIDALRINYAEQKKNQPNPFKSFFDDVAKLPEDRFLELLTDAEISSELRRRTIRVLNLLMKSDAGSRRVKRSDLEQQFAKWVIPIEYDKAITEDSIADLNALLVEMQHGPGNDVARAIVPKLAGAGNLLTVAPGTMQHARLITELNDLLFGESLYPLVKGAVEFDETIVKLGESSRLTAEETAVLNRLILQAAFPKGLRRWQPAAPFHVVNTALNIVQGEDLAWQQRKAESFIMTPLHAGAARSGFRRSHEYGERFGFSLATAVTISGAAASPNMGENTSSTLALLMTLFNIRLGWWLGNPGVPGSKGVPFSKRNWRKERRVFNRPSPFWALQPMMYEALGIANDKRSYVYLSDGGHFENLGLYEMVRRRCKRIVICDAGQDYKNAFQDLGNAIRKIRVDLGISINMKERRIFAKEEHKLGKYCAVGEILYGGPWNEEQKGTLLYLKPAFYGPEPVDVYNYGRENVEFPHESTSDQFFSESQFESYRMLGEHTVEAIFSHRGSRVNSLREFLDRAADYAGKDEPQASSNQK